MRSRRDRELVIGPDRRKVEGRFPRFVRHPQEDLVKLAADHLTDRRLLVDTLQRAGRDGLAVAEDRRAAADRADLFEEMADVDDRDPFCRQSADDLEEFRRVVLE